MTVIGPQGPRQGGGLSREDLAAIGRFFTGTPVGIVIALGVAAYLLFNLALFAVPRATLYMAQVKPPSEEEEEKDKKDGEKSCLALVVETKEDCLGDPTLPKGDADFPEASMADASPISIISPHDSIDGYFESYFDLTVMFWQRAVRDAVDDTERAHRRCITQIITDRYGTKNTFAAFSGDATTRNELKDQIGWFVTPIVRLKGPDYIANVSGRAFAPFRPDAVKETCGD